MQIPRALNSTECRHPLSLHSIQPCQEHPDGHRKNLGPCQYFGLESREQRDVAGTMSQGTYLHERKVVPPQIGGKVRVWMPRVSYPSNFLQAHRVDSLKTLTREGMHKTLASFSTQRGRRSLPQLSHQIFASPALRNNNSTLLVSSRDCVAESTQLGKRKPLSSYECHTPVDHKELDFIC